MGRPLPPLPGLSREQLEEWARRDTRDLQIQWAILGIGVMVAAIVPWIVLLGGCSGEPMTPAQIEAVATRTIEIDRPYKLVTADSSQVGTYQGSNGDWHFFSCEGDKLVVRLADENLLDIEETEAT